MHIAFNCQLMKGTAGRKAISSSQEPDAADRELGEPAELDETGDNNRVVVAISERERVQATTAGSLAVTPLRAQTLKDLSTS